MKRVLFLVFMCSTLCASSQTYSNSFFMNVHGEGKLFFVKEMRMAHAGGAKARKLRYDYTHIDARDNASITATCYTKGMTNIDSLFVLLPDGRKFGYPIEKIYNEKKRFTWKNRFRAYIDSSLWFEMYKFEEPFTIVVGSKNNDDILFKDSQSTWKRRQKKMLFIQSLVEINKQ